MDRLPLALLLVTALAAGCRDAAPPAPSPPPPAEPAVSAPTVPAPTVPLVVFLGDSLTAGLGLDEGEAFPAVLAELLEAEGTPIRAVNAGVSGDTTAGGLRRLDWLLRQEPDVLVVGLGANDGLRAKDAAETEDNLRRIVTGARAADVRVLLAGMKVPPNYGPEYAAAFEAVYPRLAEELDVALVPFLLEGVAADPRLNQADGIHPNVRGQRRVAELVLPHLRALLEKLDARGDSPRRQAVIQKGDPESSD